MFYFLMLLFIVMATFMVLALCNRHLPKWFCNKMGWHLTPIAQGFDGCSFTGTCPRCEKHVLEDSQGNWF